MSDKKPPGFLCHLTEEDLTALRRAASRRRESVARFRQDLIAGMIAEWRAAFAEKERTDRILDLRADLDASGRQQQAIVEELESLGAGEEAAEDERSYEGRARAIRERARDEAADRGGDEP